MLRACLPPVHSSMHPPSVVDDACPGWRPFKVQTEYCSQLDLLRRSRQLYKWFDVMIGIDDTQKERDQIEHYFTDLLRDQLLLERAQVYKSPKIIITDIMLSNNPEQVKDSLAS